MTEERFRWVGPLAALVLAAAASLHAADQGEVYGAPLTGSDTTKISELLDHPDGYVGRTVRIEGTVTAVCEKQGCWMSFASDREGQELRIKVDDGVIVFPLEARGRRAVAEGVFTKHELTLEQTVAFARHEAEEKGETFDPESVTQARTFYQVKATGAVVY